MAQTPGWRELNRAMWDETVATHMAAPIYDLPGFKVGGTSLRPHEIADLGDVAGRELVHLQCHIGLDTLSWARLGANVTGLDFSPASIGAARALATEIGVEAQFVCADVYDAPAALGHRTFDIVYTGVGALCWLPDIDPWARVVHDLLRPGGQLYLFEFHPLEWVLETGDDGALELRYDYFTQPEGYTAGGAVSYAGESAGAATRTVQWNHALGEVVTALARAGFSIRSLQELDREVLNRFPGMVQAPDGLYRMPDSSPSLPLMYVLRANRP